MKILIIASFFPYPAHFGGAFDVLERIKGLKGLGYDIDLVCTCKEPPKEENLQFIKQFINELIIVDRKNRAIDLFLSKPLQVVSRKSLKNIKFKTQYDYAILESESVGMILENKSFQSKKIAIRVHNNESDYFHQLGESTKNLPNKAYYYLEALKFKLYSKKIFQKVDRLWFISNKEISSTTLDLSIIKKSIHLPASLNGNFISQDLSSKNVLFIGALFMPNNVEAIMWYLKKVHPFLIKEENYKLIIVGSTGDVETKSFENMFSGYSNVEVLFNKNSLNESYAAATIFINPMLHGSGVKLKTINAIQNGLVLVSTKIGSEGIGLTNNEMYKEANNAKDFSNAILNIFRMSKEEKQKMVSRAQGFLNQNNYLTILKNEIQDEKK
jgi:polysaccharide biosynthesis protein PslH